MLWKKKLWNSGHIFWRVTTSMKRLFSLSECDPFCQTTFEKSRDASQVNHFLLVQVSERRVMCCTMQKLWGKSQGCFFLSFCTQEVKLSRLHVPLSSCHTVGMNKAHLQRCIQNFPWDTCGWMHTDAHGTAISWLLTPQRQKWIEWNKVWISYWRHTVS